MTAAVIIAGALVAAISTVPCESCGRLAVCLLPMLNLTNDPGGLAGSLAKELPSFSSSSTPITSIQIERVMLGSTTIPALLVSASTLTSVVEFKKFHEPHLHLPGGANTLQVVTLAEAQNLKNINVQTNAHLTRLEINSCALASLPQAVRNLHSLKMLSLQYCSIKMLNLALLGTLQHLVSVQLTGNNISAIYPLQTEAATTISLLDLSYNQLRVVGMAMFGALKQLNTLILGFNQLTVVAVRPGLVVTLSQLKTLHLAYNRLTGVPLAHLNATRLENLFLSGNRFTTVPRALDKFPNLQLLELSHNLLESFDFAALDGLRHLRSLELSNNALRSVLLRSTITFPNLNRLGLSDNRLESIALQQFKAPRLSMVDLTNNWLTIIPNVFGQQGIGKMLQTFSVINNPLTSGTLEQYRKYVEQEVIIPAVIMFKDELCSTGANFTVQAEAHVCCTP